MRHTAEPCRLMSWPPPDCASAPGCTPLGEGKHPADSLHTLEFDFAKQLHGLHPAKNFFDALPLLLTDGVAGMSSRSAINRTRTVCRMLGHMRRDLPLPQILNKLVGIIILIASQRDASSRCLGFDQGDRRVLLRRPRRRRHGGIDHQAMAVLHQHMAEETPLRLLPRGLLVQPGLWGRRRDVRRIGPPLLQEVDTRVPGSSGDGGDAAAFCLKLFCPPRPRSVSRRRYSAHRTRGAGSCLGQDLLKKRRGHLTLQQTVPVLGENGHVPHRRIQSRQRNQRNNRL